MRSSLIRIDGKTVIKIYRNGIPLIEEDRTGLGFYEIRANHLEKKYKEQHSRDTIEVVIELPKGFSLQPTRDFGRKRRREDWGHGRTCGRY